MGRVIALIPARTGSKGIPNKNFRLLDGIEPWRRAVMCAHESECDLIVVSSDAPSNGPRVGVHWIQVGAPLHQDDTPMFAVVKHALEQIPGEPDDIIVLLQPTQPLREPKHVHEAIRLLRETRRAQAVVSVVELPLTHSPELVLVRDDFGTLSPYPVADGPDGEVWDRFWQQPTRRQDARRVYQRDGTVYAFWRRNIDRHHSLYGDDELTSHVMALEIPSKETCPLDTEADWVEAERRVKERETVSV